MAVLSQSLTMVGASLIAGGIWWACPPAGLVVTGMIITAAGALLYRKSGKAS